MPNQVILIALASCAPLALWLPWLWSFKKQLIWPAALLDVALAVLLLANTSNVFSLLYSVIVMYKLFNYARVWRDRMQPAHLYTVSFRTALVLSLSHIGLVMLVLINNDGQFWMPWLSYALVAVQLLVAIMLFASTQRHLRTTKTLQAVTSYTDAALPSISVLVPARNETDDLQTCLQALVASDYPKLEILVLDDCSQDKRTPEIIRSFAHDGVRFIRGQVPADNWLAKNYAYQQLADAANGEYLVFCGVDLRVSPGALRELITTMLEKQKTMLSVLPQNARPRDFRTYLIQPFRYAWELSLPRRLFNRPAVLSTCWIITRSALESAGSFKATSRSIMPESYLARSTARNDGYTFLRSNLLISNKPVVEQQATAIRTRYPQLRRRPELVASLALMECASIVMPLPTALLALSRGMWLLAASSLVATIILYVVYLQVTGIMYGRSVLVGVIFLPLSVAYDIGLLHVSMFRYEFGEVHWKERNICLPVMRFDQPAVTPAAPNQE